MPGVAVDDGGHDDGHPLAPPAQKEPEGLADAGPRRPGDERAPVVPEPHGAAHLPPIVDGAREARDELRHDRTEGRQRDAGGVEEADVVPVVVADAAERQQITTFRLEELIAEINAEPAATSEDGDAAGADVAVRCGSRG